MASAPARVAREGDTLVFSGALDRAEVPALWKQASAQLTGIGRFELGAVTVVDSAGLALLAELAGQRPGVAVLGDPPGLSELRAAYRLGPALDFGGAAPTATAAG